MKNPSPSNRSRMTLLGWAALPLALVLLGILVAGNSYPLQVFANALLVASLALGLNFVVGLAGQTSFAQAAFYGVGAYTSAIITTRLGAPFLVGLLASIVVATLAGTLLGLASRRLSGSYFAIVTIGLQIIALVVFNKWEPVTGGSAGIYGIPLPEIAGFVIEPGMGFFIAAAVWLMIVTLFSVRLRQSKYGWELRMIRNDEEAASAMGIPTARRKLSAFLIGSGIAGGTGSFYAAFTGIISPTAFDLTLSATLLVTVFLAGRGSIPAVILAAVALNAIPEYLRDLQDYRVLIFGIIMMALALFLPDGVSSLVADWRRRLHLPGARSATDPLLKAGGHK